MLVRMWRLAAALLAVAALAACDERPRPPTVVPKPPPPPPPVDAGAPEPEAARPEPKPPQNVQDFPEHPPAEDAVEGEDLVRLLLDDALRAERSLEALPTPDGWQVALMAQLGLRRGQAKEDALPERALPALAPDAGTAVAGQSAWVASALLPLKALPAPKKKKAKPAVLMQLPINTEVRVDDVDGGIAQVTVEVAQEVDYGEADAKPTRVVTKPVQGVVDAAWLVPAPIDAAALVREARAQPDTEAGHDAAVVLWHRALMLERSEAAREGLLRAAWTARRASWVATAALARNFAPARNATLAWTCRGELPQAKWLSVAKRPPKALPDDVCLVGVDTRTPCDFEPATRRKAMAAQAAWREPLGLEAHPVLKLVVDARQPRAILLAGSKLEFHDSCAEFEEVDLASYAATLRRLTLPLGTKDTVVRVPVPEYHGIEYAVLSAPSETRAVEWMRSRARYRWTVGARGELQVSLQPQDVQFALQPDATAATVATAPQKRCSCDDE